MTTITQRLRGRPAHAPGATFLAYTPDGRKLITAGSNNALRIYTHGSDDEPKTVDDCEENNTAVAAWNGFFLIGSENGSVWTYDLESGQRGQLLVRSSLKITDIALSPDGKWAAIASDEMVVKIVNIEDSRIVKTLDEQRRSVKHLCYSPDGTLLAVASSDGTVYIYSVDGDITLEKRIDGLIQALETDAETSSHAVWHPDGSAFAAPTAAREIHVVSKEDWTSQKKFVDGHTGVITALSWSPNGALLATAGSDGKVLIWEARTQTVLAIYAYANVMRIAWHPKHNEVSFTTSDGELFLYTDFVQPELIPLLQKPLQSAPLLSTGDETTFAHRPLTNGHGRERDPLDDAMLDFDDGQSDDFIVDDDGAGYAEQTNGNGKRTANGHSLPNGKRFARYDVWEPKIHEPFQPGSTPWRGNRRYLCLNLIGFVWTVQQETNHTVTVEFYDREYYRDFHITDNDLFDKACLNENGTLLASPAREDAPAVVFYRPHETWTNRVDWRISMPDGEDITSISLSESYVVVATTAYIRVYTLFGTPLRVYRAKSAPTVCCAAWRDYVLSIGNGPVGGDGRTKLTCTIENVKHDEVYQNEDIVALPPGGSITSVFWSDKGDPCIYDTSGTLLTLIHWRTAGQARWVPLLDTTTLERLASGKKEESYWPVAVAQEKFHCIILKGGDKYPYFPRPLLSEFEFQVPLSAPKEDLFEDDESSSKEIFKLESTLLLNSILLAQAEDLIVGTNAAAELKADVSRHELGRDKLLLQLLNAECRLGEDRGMKALQLVEMVRGEKAVEAAIKIASRYNLNLLEEKIRDVAERRILGEDF